LVQRGERDASCDPAVIERWWRAEPDANIGVCTGPSGLLVVDEDGGEAEVIFDQWWERPDVRLSGRQGGAGTVVELLPLTLSQRTGRVGGRQLFFRVPAGCMVKSRNGFLPGVDVKCRSGYVVVPPSLHKSGRRYSWEDAGLVVADAPLLLIERMMSAPTVSGGSGWNKAGGGEAGRTAPRAEGYDYERALAEGARVGERDEFANDRAFRLKLSGVPVEEAVADMKRVWEMAEQGSEPMELGVAYGKLKRVYTDDGIVPEEAVDTSWRPPGAAQNGAEPPSKPEQPDVVIRVGETPFWGPDTRGTDVAASKMLVDLIEHGWVYCPGLGWLYWNGRRWVIDDGKPGAYGKVMEMAKMVPYRMWQMAVNAPSADRRDDLIKIARSLETVGRLNAMIKLAESDPRIRVEVKLFDQNPYLLSVGNVTLDLQTFEAREPFQGDYITLGSEVDYEPGVSREWLEWMLLGTFGGDSDRVRYFQEVAGTTLVGTVEDKAIYVLEGDRDAGKTTITNLMCSALGTLSMVTEPDNLMKGIGKGMPADERAALRGKRLLVSDEPAAGSRLNESFVKKLTGRDTMTGRELYESRIQFPVMASVLVASNHPLETSDEILLARIRPIPCVTVPEENQQSWITAAVQDPSSELCRAFLVWAVEGWARVQRSGGITPCAAVDLASMELKEGGDVVSEFWEECLVFDARSETRVSVVYAAFEAWADARREPEVLSQKRVTTALLKTGTGRNRPAMKMKHTTGGNVWVGWKVAEAGMVWPNMGV